MAVMDDLGVEIITRILTLGNFTASQLSALSVLSSEWKEACSSPCLWKVLELKAPQYSEGGLNRIAPHCANLKELHIARDACHPRALSLLYSSAWLEGLASVLSSSGRSLKKLVVATGCFMYHKDYRSAPFYAQLMRKVARFSRRLEVCEVYYNAGRCGVRKDVIRWMPQFIAGTGHMQSFTFWSPSGDCGGLDDKMLGSMVKGWPDLRHLEVAGDEVTLEGLRSLRMSKKLKSLKLQYIMLGPSKRPAELKLPEDIDRLVPTESLHASMLERLELTWTCCDPLDLQIILRLFPSLRTILICEGPEPESSSDSDEESTGALGRSWSAAWWGMQQQRLAELKAVCCQDPALGKVVKFASPSGVSSW